MMMGVYIRMMEDLWNDLGIYTEFQKRDLVAGHLEAIKDEYLKADLACYRSIPLGPCHTFQLLCDSINGHIA